LLYSLVLGLFIYKFSIKGRGVELNFFLFFTLGYAYYSIFPIVFFFYLENFTGVEFDIIKSNLIGVSESGILVYAAISLVLYVAFATGYSIPKRKLFGKPILTGASKNISLMFLLLATTLAVLTALPISGDFFKGYSEDVFVGYEDGVLAGAGQRGTFVAAVNVLFVSFLFHVSRQYLTCQNGSALGYYFKSKFFIIYFIFAVLMLSLGGRLYFVSHMIALLVMANVQHPYTITRLTLVSVFLGLAVAAGFYGVFRAGGELNFVGILVNLVQEPLYTSISLFTYLGENNIKALAAPILLLSDFTNLLPTFFWPDKAQYILKPEQLGYSIKMPLGGLHFFVSICINFGYLGSIIIMFVAGCAVSTINGKSNRHAYGLVISLLSAWSSFSLFRDPFSVSIVKNIFQYSLLLIFAMATINKLKL
ncbi:MAG: hypothetical protein ACKO0Z_05680, partial [Betaproteobacteria bacterium]